jgi:hypothetical protein
MDAKKPENHDTTVILSAVAPFASAFRKTGEKNATDLFSL